jgi:hypothetical protein
MEAIKMADVETKVTETTEEVKTETTEEVKAEAPAEAAAPAETKEKKKVDIDVNKLKGQAKEGVAKATNIVTKFFKEKPKTGKIVATVAPGAIGVCAVLSFPAPILLIVGVLASAALYVGLNAAFPTEDKAE